MARDFDELIKQYEAEHRDGPATVSVNVFRIFVLVACVAVLFAVLAFAREVIFYDK